MLREAEAEMAALKKELERTQMRAAARDRELGAAKETLSARAEAKDERRRMLSEKVISDSHYNLANLPVITGNYIIVEDKHD